MQSRLTDGGIELQILSVALVHGSDRMGKDTDWFREVAGQLTGPLPELAEAPRWARALVPGQMQTLANHLRRPSWTPLYLDVISTVLAELPVDAIRNPEHRHGGGGPVDPRPHLGVTPRPQAWGIAGRDDLARWWALVRFLDEPDGITDPWSADRALWRHRVEPRVVPACSTSAWPPAQMCSTQSSPPTEAARSGRTATSESSPHHRHRTGGSSPVLQAVVADIRRSAVDSQVSDTAEMGNVLTPLAWNLGAAVGVESLLSVLAATVPRPLVRSPRNESGRDAVLSHLLTVHVPAEDDTPADLERRLQTAAVPAQRAVELAMLAPQWAPWVEAALHRPGLASGVPGCTPTAAWRSTTTARGGPRWPTTPAHPDSPHRRGGRLRMVGVLRRPAGVRGPGIPARGCADGVAGDPAPPNAALRPRPEHERRGRIGSCPGDRADQPGPGQARPGRGPRAGAASPHRPG